MKTKWYLSSHTNNLSVKGRRLYTVFSVGFILRAYDDLIKTELVV